MPEEQEQEQRRGPGRPPNQPAQAEQSEPRQPNMSDTINVLKVADSMRLLQEAAAAEALKLPDKRLDDASPEGGAAPYFLQDAGDGKFIKVNAFGDEVNEDGKLTEAGKESQAVRVQMGGARG